MRTITFAIWALCLACTPVAAEDIISLRDGLAISEEAAPASIPRVDDTDLKRERNYPMQPPVIPHDTRGYEVNLQVNKCMSCHARKQTEQSQAPMISVTHYMDREGNFLAEISPRRYFCNQCHVNQSEVRNGLENDFRDMAELMRQAEAKR